MAWFHLTIRRATCFPHNPGLSWVFADTMRYGKDSHAVRFHKDEHPYFYVNV